MAVGDAAPSAKIAFASVPDAISRTVERIDRARTTVPIHTEIIEIAPESPRNEPLPLASVGSTA